MKKRTHKTVAKKEIPMTELHGRPISRRELLASGIIPFAGAISLPPLLSIFAKAGVAEAADLVCPGAGRSALCPLIVLNLSGGAAMAANFVPRTRDLQLLSSYSKMGLGRGSTLQTQTEFSNRALFYQASGMLQGIRTGATLQTLTNTSFVGVCVRSQDDSAMNKFDISGMAAKAGVAGSILPNLGRANTVTGNKNLPAYVRPPAPLVVGRYEDIIGALGVSGSLASLSNTEKVQLFEMTKKLSNQQGRTIQSYTGGEILSHLMNCANTKNTDLAAGRGGASTDPLSSGAFSTVWGINANTNRGSMEYVFAAMVYNALNGNAGTANLEMGGYDYHNGTRTLGDTQDQRAGLVMGRILQSFSVLNKKAVLVVTSDGAVTSPDSDTAGGPWSSDRGTAGAAYIMAYDPSGAHATRSSQLGHYTEGQAADDTFLTGGNPELAAGAIFANYLNFNSQIALLDRVIPRVFSSADLEKVLVIS